ncbi:hypothetical protein ACFZAV_38890 [Streptomyces sp. NPDC008343]|uniref:hypothetical protein n=1 Tax=Streptomyces sp. NPDC008343 TaxID=3364828 RepID=UPI0036EE0F93
MHTTTELAVKLSTDREGSTRSPRGTGRERRRRPTGALAGWLSVAPALLIILGFTSYPMVQSMLLSTDRWNMLGPRQFVGAENYATILAGVASAALVVLFVILLLITVIQLRLNSREES